MPSTGSSAKSGENNEKTMIKESLRKLCVACAALLGAVASPAQPVIHLPVKPGQFDFASPFNFPLLLSANYGELRGTHFHGGIDIKTQGVINKPVMAVADGYVARIAVSPTGFGKALYVNHADGTTTVYGHVERFDEPIEQYIHELQYARQSFAVDVAPPKDRFVYKQGDRIALSGNRGSSGGPHLHFEVRETASQRPLNVLAWHAFHVEDTIPPKAKKLYYIGIDTVQGIPVHIVRQIRTVKRLSDGSYGIADTSAMRVTGTGYFAVEAEEKKNGTANPMGVYTIDVQCDGKALFGMTVDRIPFDVGRYAYAAALYPESRSTRNGVYTLYVLPNNRLPVYDRKKPNGLLRLTDDDPREIAVALGDDCGNRSVLRFRVRRGLPPKEPQPEGIPVRWSEDYHYAGEGIRLSIPKGTLFESILLRLSTKPRPAYAYSPLYTVHTPDVPVYRSLSVSLDASAVPERLRGKALLATVGANGSRSSAGGRWKEGRVATETRSFGTFCIVVDTVPPKITPAFKPGDDFGARKTMEFTIGDDLSGIASYTATIDGKWALFEYDPKSSRLTHYFDDARWERGRTHALVLSVTDNKGNKSVFKGSYRR